MLLQSGPGRLDVGNVDLVLEVGFTQYGAPCMPVFASLTRTLHPRLYGVVHLSIASDSSPLHPATDYVQVISLEYISEVSMDGLKPGVDIPRREAEDVSCRVLDAFRVIQVENCVLMTSITETLSCGTGIGHLSSLTLDLLSSGNPNGASRNG